MNRKLDSIKGFIFIFIHSNHPQLNKFEKICRKFNAISPNQKIGVLTNEMETGIMCINRNKEYIFVKNFQLNTNYIFLKIRNLFITYRTIMPSIVLTLSILFMPVYVQSCNILCHFYHFAPKEIGGKVRWLYIQSIWF